MTLSTVLPLLQQMGVEVVDERPYELFREDGQRSWIYDFGMRIEQRVLDEIGGQGQSDLKVRFQDAFAAAWHGYCETDGFNALVLRAGLTWRQAAVLRAYARYLRQAGSPYSQEYIQNAVLAHTDIATALVRLFEQRFDLARPEKHRQEHTDALAAEVSAMIDEVTSLDEDRILRRLMAVICATLRTNYHVTDPNGGVRPYLAIKLDPRACRTCRSRARGSRSSCTRRAWRACTCASARSRAAGCGGPTAARTSAPRSSAWSRRRR